MSGPTKLNSAMRTMMTSPTTPRRWCRKSWTVSRHELDRRRGAVGTAAATGRFSPAPGSDTVAYGRAFSSVIRRIPDPRVQNGVGHVGQQVAEYRRDTHDDGEPHEH